MSPYRNGAHALLGAAHALGVRVCFANPGTTELALVRALDDVPGIRPILGLFEGVCTGAADGYARITGTPALTLLHLGPGLANGIANLHNARRAHSPIINVIGDHATWHLRFDAPLTSDIKSLAQPVSASVIHIRSADGIVDHVRKAADDALAPPGGVVTLIAPSDLMEAAAAGAAIQPTHANLARGARAVPAERITQIASRLAECRNLVLLLGSNALTERGQRAAKRIADATGARLIMESYPALVALGGDLPALERLAYFPQDVLAQLGEDTVLLAGARAPVSYFGYQDQPSELVPDERLIELSNSSENSAVALEELAEEISRARTNDSTRKPASASPPSPRATALTPVEIAEAVIEHMPAGSIISLEGSTCGGPYLQRAHRARRHWLMTNTGGAIGQGIPCALGAAVAKPDARVICLQSDGSAQYTVQALWTLAHEQLDVTVIVAANHRYGILQTELRRAGARMDEPSITRMTRLDMPRVDWVALARGYGVPATSVSTSSEFNSALRNALTTRGPYVIEAQLS